MSYVLKNESGQPFLHSGKKVLGSDSPMHEVRDISAIDKTFSICASSSRRDRLKDEVVQEGLDWKNWMKNPVILWSHRMDAIPIGKGVGNPWREKEGKVTKTFIRIKMAGHEDAVKIFDAVKEGFLRSASIGFIPLEMEKIEDKESDSPSFFSEPTRFLKSEILETSICSVPANADCLVGMKSMVQKGQLPAYCIDGLCYPDGEHLFYLDDEIVADGLTKRGLEAIIRNAIRTELGSLD